MKKFTLVAAAFGLMMLAACGDDSSSSSDSVNKDDQGRTIYNDMKGAFEAPCSPTNMCEVIILNDPIAQDTLQCNGSDFLSMVTGPVKGCGDAESASPDDVVPASPDDVVPASSDSAEPAADADTPATPAASADQGPTGDLVSCDFVAEGILGEHSCVEAAASNAVVPAFCQTMAAMGEGMTATTGTSCNAPATALKCVKNGMNFYSLDGRVSCDEFFQASVLQGLAVEM